MLNDSVVSRLAADVGESMLPTLFRVFTDEIEQIGSQLQHTDNALEVAQLAHRLKGSAASYGAEPLRQDAGSLELEAKQGKGDLTSLKRQVLLSVSKTVEAARAKCL